MLTTYMLNRLYLATVIVAASAIICAGCISGGLRSSQGPTDRHPDWPDPIPGATESRDVRSVVRDVAQHLLSIPEIMNARGDKPRMAVLRVRNFSREYIDAEIFTDLVTSWLVTHARGQIDFVDRKSTLQVEMERSRKRRGEVDASELKMRAGVDFYLEGTLRSHSHGTPRGISDWVIYSFKLIDAETQILVWADSYQTKRESLRGPAYRGAGN